MERLLMLRLRATGCEAQAWLNGIPVAQAGPTVPSVCVAVHEFTLAGPNRIEIVIAPPPFGAPPAPPTPQRSNGKTGAQLHMLLPRMGNPADDSSARTLATLVWAPPDGQAYETPLTEKLDVTLPLGFPRWRWLDAPVLEADEPRRQQALRLVQNFALELARGELDGLITAARLRVEELALAYQRRPEDELARWRQHLEELVARPGVEWQPVTAEDFRLRPLAGGRLFDCLDASGQPALKTAQCDDGCTYALPLRLAFVDGRPYVLR